MADQEFMRALATSYAPPPAAHRGRETADEGGAARAAEARSALEAAADGGRSAQSDSQSGAAARVDPDDPVALSLERWREHTRYAQQAPTYPWARLKAMDRKSPFPWLK